MNFGTFRVGIFVYLILGQFTLGLNFESTCFWYSLNSFLECTHCIFIHHFCDCWDIGIVSTGIITFLDGFLFIICFPHNMFFLQFRNWNFSLYDCWFRKFISFFSFRFFDSAIFLARSELTRILSSSCVQTMDFEIRRPWRIRCPDFNVPELNM